MIVFRKRENLLSWAIQYSVRYSFYIISISLNNHLNKCSFFIYLSLNSYRLWCVIKYFNRLPRRFFKLDKCLDILYYITYCMLAVKFPERFMILPHFVYQLCQMVIQIIRAFNDGWIVHVSFLFCLFAGLLLCHSSFLISQNFESCGTATISRPKLF